MDFVSLSKTVLFQGISPEETEKILPCLHAAEKHYEKGELLLHAGSATRHIGVVLAGGVNIEMDDVWGNKNILSHVFPWQIFAEAYACLPREPLIVNAAADEDCHVLWLDAQQIFSPCACPCGHHSRLIANLVGAIARKNLELSQRIQYTSSKSIRGRLLAYLSAQSVRQNADAFTIPFNRQQLADYLSVDRSALSNELGKMREEGLLEFSKNRFVLKDVSQR